jgi:DNA-directed RNA polymerase subunit RPC12/RpoP
LPINIIQCNERVAEVQYICDCCGKLIQTSLISKKDADDYKGRKVTCWQCKQATTGKNKTGT